MANGWVVQESSEVSSNLPVLLRVDYTKKDNQGFDVNILLKLNHIIFSKKFL